MTKLLEKVLFFYSVHIKSISLPSKMAPCEWQPVTAARAHFWVFSSFYISFALFNYSFFTTLLSSLLGSMETRLMFFVVVSILFFQRFPPCLGSLWTDLLFTVGISCWPSVAPRCSCMSCLMSPASWGGGGDAGAVPELFVIAGHTTDPSSRLSSWGI